MSNDDDLVQVERCRKGDQAAFAVLVKRYHRPLYNAAYRVLGNAEDASDITQVVFLKLTERLEDYDVQYKFFSWIYRIAINESINLLRSHQREVALEDEGDLVASEAETPERQWNARQRCDRLQSALMTMKIEDRIVLTLRHFSECSYKEMGQILDIEESTVKSRLFEARQRLGLMLVDLKAG